MAQFVHRFAWDPNKARNNRAKHGVSFASAATVFQDPLALTIYDEDHGEAEDRGVTLGRSASGALLVVVHTYTETNELAATIRIVSARRANTKERWQYERS